MRAFIRHRPSSTFVFGKKIVPLCAVTIGLALTGLTAGCEMGDTGPSPEPSSPAVEPEPQELGWEEIEGMDASIQNRWGFVSVDMGGGKAFVFGGANIDDFGGEVLGDAFIVDSTTEPPSVTTVTVPSGEVSPRYCGCGTYDASRNEVILVGGRSLQDFYIDTFVYDVDAGTFSLIDAPGPTAVIGCSATYVAGDDAAYLFGGGGNAGDLLNEMWKWDPAARTWSAVTYNGEAPSARYDGAMREVPAGGPLYLFGGFGGGEFLNDLWSFDTATNSWTAIAAVGPGGRRVPWMVAEPSGDGFYVAFGTSGVQLGEVHGDLWRYDIADGAWEDVTLADGPQGRGFSQWLPGGPGDIGLVLGGFDGASPMPEMWRLHAPDTGGF